MAASILIETDRLVLRTVTDLDADQVALHWNVDGSTIPRAEAERKVKWMLANHEQNQPGKIVHLCLAMISKADQDWVGWCGLDHLDSDRPNPVLFYLLKVQFWGQGLASEAARAVLGYALDVLNLPQVDSAAAAKNLASKRVMEKIGMRYVGLDKEGGYFFTLSQEEWSAQERAQFKTQVRKDQK